MQRTATRHSWKNEPMVNPKCIEISMHFTDAQFSRLIKGLIPQQMEEKWFIFYENGYLFFHRSWTGYCVFMAQVVKDSDGYSISEFWAERDKKKFSNPNDSVDIAMFTFLLMQGLLCLDVTDIYIDENIKSELDAVTGWGIYGSLLLCHKIIDYRARVKSALFGVAMGDALGVPVEFKSRQSLRKNPVTGLIGFGTHNMPKGTFSDDSSLTFCLAEALTQEFDLNTIGQNFVKWRDDKFWTASGTVFDIGITTQRAIGRLAIGVKPVLAGDDGETANGNGSLMRILPLVFYLLDKPIHDRFEIIQQVSSVTHGHIRSVIACFYYLEFALHLCEGKGKFQVYEDLQYDFSEYIHSLSINPEEIALFDRLLKGNIYDLGEDEICSSGYVLHTLEASIWCLMTTDNYEEAVLKAVNLGEDTDTTGAVTGGLAGLLYGFDAIPGKWIEQLARKEDIEDLAQRLGEKYSIF